MDQILNTYYANNARKLRRIVDKILFKFGGLYNKDKDDFYSLANEVFVDAMRRYDGIQSFDGFLYSCLKNKILTEITCRNREKRKADRMAVSIDAPVWDEDGCTLGELIADSFDMEEEIFGTDEKEIFSKKTLLYLSKLSNLQKEVLGLIITGYFPNEIRVALHISEKQYIDCTAAIHSYKNVSILF